MCTDFVPVDKWISIHVDLKMLHGLTNCGSNVILAVSQSLSAESTANYFISFLQRVRISRNADCCNIQGRYVRLSVTFRCIVQRNRYDLAVFSIR